MADLLRGTAAFPGFSQALRVSLVEVSPRLRSTQWQALRCSADGIESGHGSSGAEASISGSEGDTPAEGISGWNGARVSWHRSVDEVVPHCPVLYLAHEFLDALPVHQFQRTGEREVVAVLRGYCRLHSLHRWRGACRPCTCFIVAPRQEPWAALRPHLTVPRVSSCPCSTSDRGWCERLVDLATPDSPLHLRLVLSPGATPAARTLLPRRLRQVAPGAAGSLAALEVCPQVRLEPAVACTWSAAA